MLFAEKKVKAIGIDYLGIERNQPDHATHTILMKHNIAIIEGLRLADAVAGDYFFICLPLNVIGLEAAPARAVLLRI
jgi:arylformamidase